MCHQFLLLLCVHILYLPCTKWFRRLEDAAAYVKQLREQLHGEFARHE